MASNHQDVRALLEHRGELLFRQAQGIFRTFGFADVDHQAPQQRAVAVFDHADDIAHPEGVTVGADHPIVEAVVAPGGGFVGLGYGEEGIAVARRLAEHGVTAFALKYRTIRSPDTAMHMPAAHMKEMDVVIARAKTGRPLEMPSFSGEPHAVEDGERAMAIVRQHAGQWGIDPHKIGFIGFSAGAYLAADLAIGEKASRPDFVGLIYGGLRTPVPHDASPAFIAGAADDEYQPNDPILLYSAWRKAGAAAELHLFEHGGHGFGLGRKGTTSDHWFDEFIWWMQARGLLPLR